MPKKDEVKPTSVKRAASKKAETKKDIVLSSTVEEFKPTTFSNEPNVEKENSPKIAFKSNKIRFAPLKVTEDSTILLSKLKFQIPILLVLVAVLSSALTFAITKQFEQGVVDQTSFVAKISGGVALTEPELKDVVKQLKTPVYWAGPLSGSKYTINASTPGQIYVRYLPDGNGVNDLSPKYRVIGTYAEKDAYTSTLAAGNEANGVSFTTPEGIVVHYNKSAQSNVYVAFQGKDFQIEVFDPSPKTALAIASAANSIRVIK